jgi:hypothetical protein
MTLSKRERRISIVVLAAAALFVFDQVALSPYLERRRTLVDDAAARADELLEVRKVMKEEGKLRGMLVRMGTALAGARGGDGGTAGADASWAEGRILAALQEWERQAGVGKASFNRLRSTEQYGFTRLTFQVSATGKMPAIAALIYRAETAEIPLRIDQMQVMLSGDSGEELQVQLTLSTMCRTGGAGGGKPEALPRRGGGVASVDLIGGRR